MSATNRTELLAGAARRDASSLLRELVNWALDARADAIDASLRPGEATSVVRFHVDGQLVTPAGWQLPSPLLRELLERAWSISHGGLHSRFDPEMQQSCRVDVEAVGVRPAVRLRWDSLPHSQGTDVVLRISRLDALARSLRSLGFLPTQVEMLERAARAGRGAVVIGGSVGSGRSTTMRSMRALAAAANPSSARAVEVALSIDVAPQAGVRALMASEPATFVLEDLHGASDGRLFQEILLAGHAVQASMHAHRAVGILAALCCGPAEAKASRASQQVLSAPGALKLLACQTLLPLNCPHCSVDGRSALGQRVPAGVLAGSGLRPEHEHGEIRGALRALEGRGIAPESVRLRNRHGCIHCRRDGLLELAGVLGRTVVAEMIEPDGDFRALLAEAGDSWGGHAALRAHVAALPRTGVCDPDMTNKSMLENALYKVSQGLVDPRVLEQRFGAGFLQSGDARG